jgi:hypothetical protein
MGLNRTKFLKLFDSRIMSPKERVAFEEKVQAQRDRSARYAKYGSSRKNRLETGAAQAPGPGPAKPLKTK